MSIVSVMMSASYDRLCSKEMLNVERILTDKVEMVLKVDLQLTAQEAAVVQKAVACAGFGCPMVHLSYSVAAYATLSPSCFLGAIISFNYSILVLIASFY